jgi:ATP-binding cassette subfamily B protein
MNSSQPNHPILWRRLLEQMRPYWLHILGICAVSLLACPIALLMPLPLKIAVDSVIGDHRLPRFLEFLLPQTWLQSKTVLLWFAVGLVIVVALLAQARDFATSILSTYTGEKLLRGFRARLFGHVQRLSLGYHDTRGTSDSTYRIQYDANCVHNLTVDGVIPFVTSSVTLASMIYVTARINWPLALVALAVCPILFLLSRTFRRRLRRQSREVKKIESSAMAVVQQTLGAIRTVKAFGQEGREQQRFIEKSDEGMRARLRLAWAEGGFGFGVALVTALSLSSVLFFGLTGVRSGALTLGELLLVMGYVAQLHSPLKTISKKMTSMQGHLASAERAFALLDEAPDVIESPHARGLARAFGAMAFRNVSFAYNAHQPVLSQVSFELAAGTCLGMAGTTGAGKTTLVNLLTRFYDPTEGQILLDGIDLRDYKLVDLRHQFAIVLQEPVLFSTSVAENIAYARPGATRDELVAAASAANAHDFISRLPQGYDTLVGERGMCLSGGERQRIALARAFLKDAPILILDEPTSSVDLKTEGAIVQAMQRLMQGRTTFIIAHRLSTLKHCDLILKIEGGRVVSLEKSASEPALGTRQLFHESGTPYAETTRA